MLQCSQTQGHALPGKGQSRSHEARLLGHSGAQRYLLVCPPGVGEGSVSPQDAGTMR